MEGQRDGQRGGGGMVEICFLILYTMRDQNEKKKTQTGSACKMLNAEEGEPGFF